MRSRLRIARELKASGDFPAAILFYHRVADSNLNRWSLSNRNFIKHLDWIQKHRRFVSLDEIRSSQISGTRSEAMVGLTFDDGYAENLDKAIPELLRREIPCTYFVSTHFIETGEPFPHDLAAGVPIKPNSIADIQRLAAEGITIGGHTDTHIDLGKDISPQQMKIEISDSRKKLQDWVQQPVQYFAFPFGLKANITQRSIDAVFEAGFESFVSAAGGLNWPGSDPRHMHRIHGDPGIAAIKNWLTLDPRKMRSQLPLLQPPPKVCGLPRTEITATTVGIPT